MRRPARIEAEYTAAMRVSVIIPTLDAAGALPGLLAALRRQTRPPDEVVVIDSSSADNTAAQAAQAGAKVVTIAREAFDHGRTRNLAVDAAAGDMLVFLTQDVMPVDDVFLERLTAPLSNGEAVAAFARQVVPEHGPPTEAYLRLFNYPPGELVSLRTAADVQTLGVRAFMLSNAASAVQRDAFNAAGRFADRIIMNEDMLLCARLLRAGHAVAYVPRAMVWHSHRYSLGQHFRRYFDIGVFMTTHRDELGVSPGGGTGMRFVTGQLGWLVRQARLLWLPCAIAEAAAKWLGYRLGRAHRSLGPRWSRRLSMHKGYWRDAS
jgi:rhamnosyltransferase